MPGDWSLNKLLEKKSRIGGKNHKLFEEIARCYWISWEVFRNIFMNWKYTSILDLFPVDGFNNRCKNNWKIEQLQFASQFLFFFVGNPEAFMI